MAVTVSNAHAQPRPGMGSLGAHLGMPYFIADTDTRSGERPRILGQFHFQYKASERWRISSEFGFGWVGYDRTPLPPAYRAEGLARTGDSTKVDVLTKFQPVTFTALYSLRPHSTKWAPYVGAGVNMTRMEIVDQRERLQDPATFDPWIKWSPGVQGELGTELYLKSNRNVSLDWSLRGDYQFSKDTKRFPSGFTGNDGYVALSFGVNVYFWPGGQKPIEIAPAAAPEPAPAAPAAPAPAPTPAPTPPPATPDTTHVPPPPPPPAPTPATPDTTKHSPAPHDAPAPASTVEDSAGTFGAFGLPLPSVVTPRREEVVEPR